MQSGHSYTWGEIVQFDRLGRIQNHGRLTELDENGNIGKAFNIENVKSGNWKVMINEMYELQRDICLRRTGFSRAIKN